MRSLKEIFYKYENIYHRIPVSRRILLFLFVVLLMDRWVHGNCTGTTGAVFQSSKSIFWLNRRVSVDCIIENTNWELYTEMWSSDLLKCEWMAMCLRRMPETWLDSTHRMCSAAWYIATSLIHITGNWTSKPTESRKEHTWHGEEWTNLGAPRHRSCTTFLRRQLFYPEGFVVWSPSRGLHKCTLFPFSLLESLGWCRSRCHVDLLFNFAGMFFVQYYSTSGMEVFWLATLWPSAMFICCHVRVIELPVCATVGVIL